MKSTLRSILNGFLVVSLFAGAANLRAQGTAFTYQGLLDVSNSPANGSYSLIFQLYNAATTNGTAIDLPLTQTNVAVSNGLFTVSLNFTNINFIGTNYWVQISAATNGGTNFEALSPLLPITPAPYAISAGTASNLLGALPLSQLPAAVVTNNESSVTLSGTFSGSGAGLTGVIAASVVGGFTNSASNIVSLTNVGNVFVGSGAGLSNLNAWSLTGNAGLTPGSNFLGTTDTNTLQFRVNGMQALLLDGSFNSNKPNVIGGSASNSVGTNIYGATIAGGYKNNMVDAPYGTIGGGSFNTMTNVTNAVIAGGEWNSIYSYDNDSAISGGTSNYIGADSLYSTIAGGYSNNIDNGQGSVIGGGRQNTIQGGNVYATIPGGFSNLASGSFSFAAGHQAQAFHQGAFVWADSQNASFGSTNNDSFSVRARGGVTFATAGAALTVGGPVVASGFSGSGAGLTGLAASNLSGTVSLAQLPGTVVTNTATNVTLSGTFSGNGAGLTNLWSLTGNANTTPGVNFVGTTDNQPLQIWANGARALLLDGSFDTNGPNVVGGSASNSVAYPTRGGTVAGGIYDTIGAEGYHSTIGGGHHNSISNNVSDGTISGGHYNTIQPQAFGSTISGGGFSVIQSNAQYATVPGGYGNIAGADYTLAAGLDAQATNQGAFVWADSQGTPFGSTANDQFLIRAAGGVGINTNNPNGAALNVHGAVVASSFTGNGGGLTNLILTNPAPSLPVSFGAMTTNTYYTNTWNRFAFVSLQFTNNPAGADLDNSFYLFSTNSSTFPPVEAAVQAYGHYVRDFMLPPNWWFSVTNNDSGASGISTNYIILQ